MSVTLEATDNPGTTTESSTPPTYTLYLQVPGAPQQVVQTAIPSGAPLGVIDWDELPLANGVIPPAAPQTIVTLNDVLILRLTGRAGQCPGFDIDYGSHLDDLGRGRDPACHIPVCSLGPQFRGDGQYHRVPGGGRRW